MNPAYLPKTPAGRRWRLAEECAEVVKELGKIGRFGLDSYDPRTGLSNKSSLLLEIDDFRHAIAEVEKDLRVDEDDKWEISSVA